MYLKLPFVYNSVSCRYSKIPFVLDLMVTDNCVFLNSYLYACISTAARTLFLTLRGLRV